MYHNPSKTYLWSYGVGGGSYELFKRGSLSVNLAKPLKSRKWVNQGLGFLAISLYRTMTPFIQYLPIFFNSIAKVPSGLFRVS